MVGRTPRNITTPLTEEVVCTLQAGDLVTISGYIYTARDAAHKKIYQLLQNGDDLPFEIQDQLIYYVGPTPTFDDHVIGSAGPTTAKRMDKYAPLLHASGLRATIGKGDRSSEVKQSLVDHTAVYFAALGGTGALLSKCIKQIELIAYPELGTEAIYRLKFESFPAIVIYDCHGNDFYQQAQSAVTSSWHRFDRNPY